MLAGLGYELKQTLAQTRENDRLVRNEVAAALGEASEILRRMEASYRSAKVPPPSRQQPFPPANVQTALSDLRTLREQTKDLMTRVETMETAAPDHLSRRMGDEPGGLATLVAHDLQLVAAAREMRNKARALTLEAIDSGAARTALEPSLAELAEQAGRRRAALRAHFGFPHLAV